MRRQREIRRHGGIEIIDFPVQIPAREGVAGPHRIGRPDGFSAAYHGLGLHGAAAVRVKGYGAAVRKRQLEGNRLAASAVVSVGDLCCALVHRQDAVADGSARPIAGLFDLEAIRQGGKGKGAVFTNGDRMGVAGTNK